MLGLLTNCNFKKKLKPSFTLYLKSNTTDTRGKGTDEKRARFLNGFAGESLMTIGKTNLYTDRMQTP